MAVALATGGAYAAENLGRNSVGSKQVKNASLTGKDVKDDSLTGKDVDESSLNLPAGPRGATGPQGPQGDQGLPGTTGPAGPLLDTLPSGRTLRGAWAVGDQSTGSGSTEGVISFPYPLASAPTAHILDVGDPSTTNCPGSVSQPEARAGHLCLYSGVQSNVAQLQTCGVTAGGCGTTSRFGVALEAVPNAGGAYFAWGSWAVTAP